MPSTSSGNKRLAKNTLLLYVRMLFMMCVTLYTSRVVLATLGVEDYGIYNVVGGFITLFGFLSSAMSSATSRYLTFALGRGDGVAQRRVFAVSFQTHGAIALVVLLLSESLGWWFVETRLVVDEARRDAAFWVFQCSALTMAGQILTVPYTATLIARERMSAFAYISVGEAVAKLLVVYLLAVAATDKLVTYAVLLLTVQLAVQSVYILYCRGRFAETRYRPCRDGALHREMIAFAGWNLMGNMASVLSTQGVNVLLNLFFSPAVNAARAVAVQAQSAVAQFATNFQMALNPQIIKTYAGGCLDEMHRLVVTGSRFSFFLLFALSLPLYLMTPEVLSLWLGHVPAYADVFLRLTLVVATLDGVAGPLMASATASGRVRVYQTVVGGIIMLIAPLSYVVLKWGAPPPAVFVVHVCVSVTALLARLVIVRRLVSLSLRHYLGAMCRSCLPVIATGLPLPLAARYLIAPTGLGAIALLTLVSVASVASAVYLTGITRRERAFVKEKIAARWRKL